MAEIVLSRIDPRFVHGRVLPKWSEESGADCAVIVDDILATDDLMTTIYQQTGQRQNIPVACYCVDEFCKVLDEGLLGEHKILLLLRDIATTKRLLERGISISRINVGALVHKEGTVQINGSVALSEDDAKTLASWEQQGICVALKSMPKSEKISAEQALEQIQTHS